LFYFINEPASWKLIINVTQNYEIFAALVMLKFSFYFFLWWRLYCNSCASLLHWCMMSFTNIPLTKSLYLSSMHKMCHCVKGPPGWLKVKKQNKYTCVFFLFCLHSLFWMPMLLLCYLWILVICVNRTNLHQLNWTVIYIVIVKY
jgi:hypothetical protein